MEEFYAFADTRRNESGAQLGASLIIRNVVVALTIRERKLKAPCAVLPELGVQVSDKGRPEPDILVIPSDHRSTRRSETFVR